MSLQILTEDKIRAVAPSVFGVTPHPGVSERYGLVSTWDVIKAMELEGFVPVKAGQTAARTDIRRMTNRHIVRFRHLDAFRPGVILPDAIPEVVLFNSHNRTCAFRLLFGVFRFVCSNGLIVQSQNLGEVQIRHTERLAAEAVSASHKILDGADKVSDEIISWQNVILDKEGQEEYASGLLDHIKVGLWGDSCPEVVEQALYARRREDMPDTKGKRNLWKTMNVIQENVIKGGIIAPVRSSPGKFRDRKPIKAVHADELINRRMWDYTARQALAA